MISILLEGINTTPTRVLPDNYGLLFIISEIVVTAIIFIGVYYIFKPMFENKKKEDSK